MVRFNRSGFLITALGCGLVFSLFPGGAAQQQEKKSKPKDQMFSGTVTSVEDTSLTATRSGQGNTPVTKTFAITPETQFDGGRPNVNSRVTVRYITTDEGDRAIRVIVRGTAKK